jgi:serine/threonine protein kinase
MATAKDFLHGLTLGNGWKVVKKTAKAAGESGGNFSTGYTVESPQGELYFLKAIDFDAAMRSPDPARALQVLTEAFNLERDILEISKRLSHVVTVVADGTQQVTPPGPPGTPAQTVQYLILELAEESLRHMAATSRRLPMPRALAALHNVANGLRQLNQKQVAHQDMKPSNALRFSGQQFKVCDVGRASLKGRPAPHDGLNVAGDPTYAPPELLYGQVHPEFVVRRLGCDAYLLGSLAAFLIVGLPMTALIVDELDPTARPAVWAGTYAAVLPQVRAAYARALDRVAAEIPTDAPYREELLLCIRQLCDPDPAVRGHPTTRATLANVGNVYDLERYVSIFDRLALEAKMHEQRRPPA